MKWKFIGAVLAGVVAGVVSSFGLPFMSEAVFPLIFVDESGATQPPPEWLKEAVMYVTGGELTQQMILVAACLMLPLVFLVRGVMMFLNTYFLTDVGLRVVEQLRLRAFNRLQYLSLAFHKKHREGDLLSRVMADTAAMQKAVVRVMADLVIQPATLIGAVWYLVMAALSNQGAMFMLLALSSLPLLVLPLRAIGSQIVKRSRKTQKQSGGLSAVLSENLSSQQEIRAYNLQASQSEQFEQNTDKLIKLQLKTVKYNRLMGPMVEIVSAVAISFAIYLGAQEGMTLKVFLPMVMALYLCYDPIKKLGVIHGQLKQAEASLERIEEITESSEELIDPASPKHFGEVRGLVEFKDVRFGYGDEPVLNHISVKVEPGEAVALVGPSGAGKSTFISLIARFYDVNEGSLTVEGLDVREVLKHDLRGNIALVSQHPLLFRGSIADNIAVGKPGANRDEIEKAAKLAQAHEFIMSMPDGYDTLLGERGEGLSGGQRQRVAIARAFLKDAPILILDEATSALDTESEAQIQKSLVELSKGRTTFMIAHRFSSIRHASRILVFHKGAEGGEIIADGTHAELFQSCDLYRDLYEKQLS
ncbi:lipid A export ATP-binding/permease protein MsbA [Rubritalea halochordaticola]|uniref:Lipid A export ATP-binding/permease protein MsbA n=1 Tax=Rubritalea halochordaticola TaxID=714537 RepID=A0ABP9V0H5_9BACT